jgi:serine/threonine protein kinase
VRWCSDFNQGCLPLCRDADALRWSLHIAGALQYLHESSPAIMHRDLKLDNVLLTSPDTSVANAKVCCQAGDTLAGGAWQVQERVARTHPAPNSPLPTPASPPLLPACGLWARSLQPSGRARGTRNAPPRRVVPQQWGRGPDWTHRVIWRYGARSAGKPALQRFCRHLFPGHVHVSGC